MSLVSRVTKRARSELHAAIERTFRPLESRMLSRGPNLRMIPKAKDRRGGTTTYAEWGYTIGFFQPLIFQNLPTKRPLKILDVGSGVGRIAIACEPYLSPGDQYVGLDVMRADVEFCCRHFGEDKRFSFIHFDHANGYYAPDQTGSRQRWPLEDGMFDLVTAISVWTHLLEDDARFYLRELARVLKPGGRALVTFFVMDALYSATLLSRSDRTSRYYPQPESNWIFGHRVSETDWYHPAWAQAPEEATAMTDRAFKSLIVESGLQMTAFYPGSWKEQPGLFFQDVAIFEKRPTA